jgi:hypothetical protein
VAGAPNGSFIQVEMPDGTEVTLPKNAFGLASDNEMTVEIVTSAGAIQLERLLMGKMAEYFTGEEVTIRLVEVAADDLSKNQKREIRKYQVEFMVSADIFNEKQELHDFGGGGATIRLNFTPKEGVNYGIIYVAEDGTIEQMDSLCGADYMEFVTGHFSTFAVVELDEEGNMVESENGFEDDLHVDNLRTLGLIVIGVIAGIVVVAAVVVVVIIKKRNSK